MAARRRPARAREGVHVSLIGVIIGLVAAIAATRLIRAQLSGVDSIDPPSLTIAIAVLMATAGAASYVPARRTAKVGPLDALRAE